MRFFTIISVMFLLQGCLSTIFIGSTFFTVKSIVDPRTFGRQIDDNTIETFLNIKINKDKDIFKNSRINPVVYNGKVLLIGQCFDILLIKKAEELVKKTHGVKKVYNRIQNTELIGLNKILLDFFITASVKFKILNSGLLNLSTVKVITENKEVFLFGFLTKEEEKIILKLVSRIKYIKKVITIFEYV